MELNDGLELMTQLFELYPAAKASDAQVALFAERLLDLEFEDVKVACEDWGAEEKWPPSLAELRHVAQARARERRITEAMIQERRQIETTSEGYVKPEQIAALLKEFADRMAERTAEALGDDPARGAAERLRALPLDSTDRLAIVPKGRVGPDPEYVRDGPPCAVCGLTTWRDGGRYWFCDCGWLVERYPAMAERGRTRWAR